MPTYLDPHPLYSLSSSSTSLNSRNRVQAQISDNPRPYLSLLKSERDIASTTTIDNSNARHDEAIGKHGNIPEDSGIHLVSTPEINPTSFISDGDNKLARHVSWYDTSQRPSQFQILGAPDESLLKVSSESETSRLPAGWVEASALPSRVSVDGSLDVSLKDDKAHNHSPPQTVSPYIIASGEVLGSSRWSQFYDLYEQGYNVRMSPQNVTDYVHVTVNNGTAPRLHPVTIPSHVNLSVATLAAGGLGSVGSSNLSDVGKLRLKDNNIGTANAPTETPNSGLVAGGNAPSPFRFALPSRSRAPFHKSHLFYTCLVLILVQGIETLLSLTAQTDFMAAKSPGGGGPGGADLPEDPFDGQIDASMQGIATAISGILLGVSVVHVLMICVLTRARTGRPGRWCNSVGSTCAALAGLVALGISVALLVGESGKKDLRAQACMRAQAPGVSKPGSVSTGRYQAGVDFAAICGKSTAGSVFGLLSGAVWECCAWMTWNSLVVEIGE
ncbi:hypothetical protein HDU76_012415 [Blyttiomyces sp. JEL0837]|nr:hypothetical protein HDU76_012415 [Blyttiomyces sp. JEL0837]